MNQNREVVLRQQGAVFFGRRPDSEPQK